RGVRQRARRPAEPHGVLEDPARARARRRDRHARPPARAAALVRDPSARRRRGPARGPGAAGSRFDHHHRHLHPSRPGLPTRSASHVSSSPVTHEVRASQGASMNRVSTSVALLGLALWAAPVLADSIVLPKAGQVGLSLGGGYGTFLETGNVGSTFSSGPSFTFRIPYRIRYERGIRPSFVSPRLP